MMSSMDEAISLHIRRTDYLANPNHTALELSYYEEALTHFGESFPVIVFLTNLTCVKNKIYSLQIDL